MQKSANTTFVAPVLDDLVNDSRLARLFSKDARHCALQLWILQIKSEQTTENRVVYGRLLPYSHSNSRWSASEDDNFQAFGQIQAQVIRLNLYLQSDRCGELLRQLSSGQTVSAISEQLKLEISDKLKARLGETSLDAANLVYRPVAYLLNRDAHERRSPSSPHGGAGALSASIVQTDKGAQFRLGHDYNASLTSSVIKQLNTDTGQDFGGTDTVRLGDLELLVFPTLDDLERRLLSVSWSDTRSSLVARFNPMQVPNFSRFQLRLSIENDGHIVYSAISMAERDKEGILEYEFEVSPQLSEITDSAELEIFGYPDDQAHLATLCCRWRTGYIREIHFQGHVLGGGASPVKFDWLERTTRPSTAERVKAALTMNRGDLGFTNQVGGRAADPWVPANRDFKSLFKRLHPLKSEGNFFLRWGQGDGEGRLQFVEWFKALLAKYQQHQIIIFDPYFEAAGLGLVLLCAAPKANYIVFTSLPKPTKESEATPNESDKPTQGRINNLIASCEHNSRLLQKINLRIYGLKDGRLHDRYILVMGPDQLPAAGFNLSNSFQKAAENYPLLVTPIPADVLLKVEEYKSGLVQEADTAETKSDTENPAMSLLFDSMGSPTVPRRYEPLRFLENTKAGDVLSAWVGNQSLQGLSGDLLKERMRELGLLVDSSLELPETANLRKFLEQQGISSDFTTTWEVLGEVLANSRTEHPRLSELESKREFLDFLAQYIKASFIRTNLKEDKELAMLGSKYFRESVEKQLYSAHRVDHLYHPTKYAALNWPEYYAIKFLWWYEPDSLLSIAEAEASNVPIEPQEPDAVRLSLLSQIVSEISLTIQFDISVEQRDRLIRSSNGLLQWMGLSALEKQLDEPGGLATVLQIVNTFAYPERVRALGWMVHNAAKNPKKAEIFNGLVTALHEILPRTIPAEDLRSLVDSMRGHMRQLTWAEPWLFRDVVLPLLQNERAHVDDACDIWMQELSQMLEPQPKGRPGLFEKAKEGQTTNITAFLCAYSTPEQQQASLRSMHKILKRQRQILQQPLASTSSWTRWDAALTVSLWVLAFSRWIEYYLRERGTGFREFEQLSEDSRALAMIRPMAEWRSGGAGTQVQLAEFLDQVEDILATSNEIEE